MDNDVSLKLHVATRCLRVSSGSDHSAECERDQTESQTCTCCTFHLIVLVLLFLVPPRRSRLPRCQRQATVLCENDVINPL